MTPATITNIVIISLVITEITLIFFIRRLIAGLKRLSEQIKNLDEGINKTVEYTKSSATHLENLGTMLKDGKATIEGELGMLGKFKAKLDLKKGWF